MPYGQHKQPGNPGHGSHNSHARPPVNVQRELAIYEAQKNERAWWDTWWQNINEFCMPRRAFITEYESTPDGEQYDRVRDTTAFAATAGLANMLTSRLTPYGQQWQKWGMAPELQDDEEACRWMEQMSEISLKYKADSTFYREIHMANEDKAGPGTGCVYLGHGKRRFFDYKHIELGSYSFLEDAEGIADTMWREFRLTGLQAREMFPEATLPGLLATAATGVKPSDYSRKYRILHIVRRRDDYDPDKVDNLNMPYEELYISIEDEALIQEGGYESFPFMVSRFQKWGNQHVWGVSPCRKAMPAIHQVNFLQDLADQLSELQVNPRIKQLVSMVGEVDMRAGGRTIGENVTQLDALKEWATVGDMGTAINRIEQKQLDIKTLYYQSLWEGIGHVNKEMTATEVEERRRQDELLFSPVLNSHHVDIQPLAKREYQMLMDAGIHPPLPDILLQYAGDTGRLPDPVMTTRTELALAIERNQAGGMDRIFERLLAAYQIDESIIDEFDLAQGLREMARAEGVRESIIRPERDVIEIQEARAARMQQQQQMDTASQVAEAAGKAPDDLLQAAGAQ